MIRLRRAALVLVVGAALGAALVGAVRWSVERTARGAAEDVTAQIAGDVQAAFDPATLRPATNPAGALHLVLGPDGEVVAAGALPLRVDPSDVVAGLPQHVTVERAIDAADGTGYRVIAAVPTAVGDAAVRTLALAVAVLLTAGVAGALLISPQP